MDITLDDIQVVGVHRQEVQTGEDDLQQQNADDGTADLADAADEGDTADDTGRNGVSLIVQAGGGVDGGDTGGIHETGDAVEHTGHDEHQDDGLGDIDAGDVGSLFVGAYSIHILAEGRLVPDHPDNGGDNGGVQHIAGDGNGATKKTSSISGKSKKKLNAPSASCAICRDRSTRVRQVRRSTAQRPTRVGFALNALISDSKDPAAPEYACIKELMDAVDDYIPTPDRKADMPFLMPVEDKPAVFLPGC